MEFLLARALEFHCRYFLEQLGLERHHRCLYQSFAKISGKQLFRRPRLDNDSSCNSFMTEVVFQYNRELCHEKVITLNWFSKY